jgi:PAS domain S-box-containing protein
VTIKPNGTPVQGDPRQQYEQLVASINGIVWEFDVATFLVTFVSQQAERLLGYPLEQWFLPGFWLDHLHPDDRDWAYETCMEATREKRPHELEYRMIAADGRTVWLRDIVSVTVEGDVATKLRGIMVDVTERKRTEAALRESEELFRFLAENINDPITLIDEEGHHVYVSPSFRRLLGRDIASVFTGVHPDDLESTRRAWQEIWSKGEAFVTYRIAHADGSWRIFEGRGTLVQYKGKPHVLAVNCDVTERKRAEEAIRWQTRVNDAMFRQAITCFVLLDRDFRFIRVNEAFARHYGKHAEDFVGRKYFDVIPYDGAPTSSASLFEEILRTKQPIQAVARPYVFADQPERGTTYWDWILQPILNGCGEVEFFFFSSIDVTERERAETALRHTENQLRTLVEHYPDFIARFNGECRHLYVSPSVTRAFGIPLEVFVGKTLDELTIPGPSGQNEILEAGIRQAFEQGLPNTLEARWPTPEGERVFEIRHVPERDEHGRIVSVLGLTRDVTERKRAEEALRRSEAYLAEAQRLSRAGSWAWNVSTRQFVHWSQEHYRLHGLDPQRGIPSWEEASQLIHPEDRARCLEDIDRAIQGRTVCDLEYRAVLPDGSIRHIHSVAHPFFNASGELVEFVGTELDVTERKRSEAALRESEQRYREVFDYSSECIFLLDVLPDGRFRFVAFNPAEEQAVGFSNADVAGRFIEDVLPADLAPPLISNYSQCVESGNLISYDEELNLPIGRKSFQTTLIPVRDESGRIYRLVGMARDVTDTRRAEAELRRSEEMLRRAQGIGHVGSWVFEVTSGIFFGSEQGCRMCGWEHVPHRAEDLLAIIHPDDLSRMQTAWQATLAGAPYEIEHRMVVDRKVRWVNVRAEPEFDAEGRVERITGVTQDITERKAGEEALRASLREKEVLLKEVHHRVKNNLQLISSLLALQAGKLKDRAAAEAFAESQNRVRSMALVHENLYRSGDLSSVRLAGHLESLCAHLIRSYNIDPDRIKVDLRLAEVVLDLDRSIRLGLLVNELVSNVFKHAFPAERNGRVLVQLDMPRAGCYIVVVSDNGVGLPPDLAPGHSDSLGLQLIADLTEQLGGTLVLEREGGTTISIRFPAPGQEDFAHERRHDSHRRG